MTTPLKLTVIGASTGVVIPREMLTRMRVGEGDVLYAVATPDGGYRLTPDRAFAARMGKAEEIMQRYGETLRALAR